jgi:hypothetical protein
MKNKRKNINEQKSVEIIAPPLPESISDEEYTALIAKLDFNDNTRNNLLTFSFTAVLALLGVIFVSEEPITPAICLLPYMLILPFTARIVYYRISSAHIDSFLKCFDPNRSVFKWGSTEVREKHNRVYWIIAWFVNHEMVMLSVLVGGAYYYQYNTVNGYKSWKDYMWLLIPLLCTALVFLMSQSTNKYRKLYDHYMPEWYRYKNKKTGILPQERKK